MMEQSIKRRSDEPEPKVLEPVLIRTDNKDRIRIDKNLVKSNAII